MRIERELSTDLGEKVVIYVDQPMKSDRLNEFFCKIGIEGTGIDKSTIIYGIDPMQAMLLSIRHLNSFAEMVSESLHPRRLIWDLGENDNDFGLSI